ncbi:LysE family translocator [uncultured Maricaulis sp.]|uniref:LysE family translocator n=1 Tax=uncultured Maricaulis sp. TaxID=174710 RepID=UPI0030D8A727|tara:strand:- start:73713 stop:74330 length:618 start_codon:yes stop_codon:yes gene_type:complete
MIELASLLTFAFTVLVIELTPGPNMAWLAVLSVNEGRRAGLAAVAGIALGLGLVGLAAALGLGAVIERSDMLYGLLRWGGVSFLFYLAWEGWREAGETAPVEASQGLRRYFLRGFVINILNPKAALFYIAVFPEFIDPAGPVAQQAVMLAAISVLIATLIHLAIIALAGSARLLLDNRPRRLIVQRALSLLLVAVALWLLVSTAR